jgi:hypothetical protein
MKKDTRHPKRISARKLAANQQNAQKSTGPHNSTLTRFNAVKHGLLAQGVTEIDNPEGFSRLGSRLEAELDPIGEIENALVRHIALCLVRLRRAALVDAESLTERLNPPVTETRYPDGCDTAEVMERLTGKTVVLDPGLPARLSVSDVEALQKIQRYETSVENKLFRALNQLERRQRIRHGDKIPAPASLDVSVHRESDDVASFGKFGQG